MIVELYQKSKKEIWDDFIDRSKNATFLFKRNYMDYHSDRFKDMSLMFYDNNKKLISVLPSNINKNILYSHQGLSYGGFITSNKIKAVDIMALFKSLIYFCKDAKIKKIFYKTIPHIYHKIPAEEDIYSLFINNANLVSRNISTAINLREELKISHGKKENIKKHNKLNINLNIEEKTDYKDFMNLLNNNLETKYNTSATHSVEEISLLANNFPNNIKLYTVCSDKGELLAGTILYIHNKIVHTQYLASSNNGKKIGALDFLIYSLITSTYKDFNIFNFGISTENEGRYLNEGLIKQKEAFGGRTICYDQYKLDIF